ncbi:conserved hypothetical protein [Frankia canadensis]|uniref:SnoaL-like domain-containing protein n=1 Tax=Frankia canadensis TaxID=1836972 RepID=A0A2I2L2C1_9ACTN|nr:conserved hypothetical protein [Frankia canadensis]SOU59349.1 conserved hypothetical protein [Frankia canadensis]
MADPRRTADRVEELWVRTRCVELGARYCHGVDQADQATFLSVWHADGEYVIGRRAGRFRGHAELASALDFVRAAYVSTHHWTTNQVVTRTGTGSATGVSDSFAVCVDHDDRPTLVAATYDDEYRLVGEEWKIWRRIVRRWLVSDGIEVALRHPASVQARP